MLLLCMCLVHTAGLSSNLHCSSTYGLLFLMSHTVTMLCCLTITINSRHVIHRAMSIAAPGQPGITLGFSLTVSKGLLCSCVFFSIAAVLKAVTHLQENARGAQQ